MILRNGKFSGKILLKIFWKIFHLTSVLYTLPNLLTARSGRGKHEREIWQTTQDRMRHHQARCTF
jgi:hypothetical protein